MVEKRGWDRRLCRWRATRSESVATVGIRRFGGFREGRREEDVVSVDGEVNGSWSSSVRDRGFLDIKLPDVAFGRRLAHFGDYEWDEGAMIRAAGTRASLRYRVVRSEQGRRRRSRWVGGIFAHAGTGSPCDGEAILCSV